MRTARKGQGIIEFVIALPLIAITVIGMVMIVYGTWQDLRLQMIANYAGRAQGLSRVAGGSKLGDSNQAGSIMGENYEIGRRFTEKAGRFLNYKDLKFDLSPDDEKRDGVSIKFNLLFDQVTIRRTPRAPKVKILNMEINPNIKPFEARAYGGEDPLVYALPRWQKHWRTYQSENWKNGRRYSEQDSADDL